MPTLRPLSLLALSCLLIPLAGARPVLDRYGQSTRKSYEGKITSDEQLRHDVRVTTEPFVRGPGLDAFGGLAGSGARLGLKKTGFFHVAEVAGRHVLVTPAGNVFFQLGVCGIASTDDYTLVKGREHIYEWLPPRDPDDQFASAWRPGSDGIFSF